MVLPIHMPFITKQFSRQFFVIVGAFGSFCDCAGDGGRSYQLALLHMVCTLLCCCPLCCTCASHECSDRCSSMQPRTHCNICCHICWLCQPHSAVACPVCLHVVLLGQLRWHTHTSSKSLRSARIQGTLGSLLSTLI